jgi:glycosyltransferase involved in cell wall biosynthesis
LDNPLVSIITPSLNQGRYIAAAIRSIRGQAYPHVEHIIVDGGSTDSTIEIIKHAEHTYPMRWLSEPDTGMYEAINKGLHLARGELFSYLNADDRYFPWTISTIVEAFRKHPDVGFVFGDMLNLREGSGTELLLYPPFRLSYVSRIGFLGQPTVFWRRRVRDEIGPFDESLKFVSDCDYWIRMGKHHRGHRIDEVLAIERDHPHAKRFAQASAVNDELVRVRNRYDAVSNRTFLLGLLADRMHGFFWRRLLLARFVMWWLRRKRAKIGPGQPWSSFLNAAWPIQLSPARTLAAALPRIGGRFRRSMITFRVEP